MAEVHKLTTKPEKNYSKDEVLEDFEYAFKSRLVSLIGRKEVLSGKAKFGIFGDGKEIPCVAMARAFRRGDWRSGYYRDQTFAIAVGLVTIKQLFAQLYADTDLEREPMSGGRQMNNHFGNRYLNSEGEWIDQTKTYNSSSDISPTGGQMPRLVGLGYASKLYRKNKNLQKANNFSDKGNEVCFGTIGNASTSEGLFFESINAIGVLELPIVMSIWDDGYGISVTNRYQTVKESISKALSGFKKEPGSNGYHIYNGRGWNYQELREIYENATDEARKNHIPALVHVEELSQPQGHSTSGSHERYKDENRLKYEKSIDGINKMKEWMVSSGYIRVEELEQLEKQFEEQVRSDQKEAWNEFYNDLVEVKKDLIQIYDSMIFSSGIGLDKIKEGKKELEKIRVLSHRNILSNARKTLRNLVNQECELFEIKRFIESYKANQIVNFRSHLYAEGEGKIGSIPSELPEYSDASKKMDGRLIIRHCFEAWLKKDPNIFIIGEDVGMGGVNLEFENLNDTFGDLRVCDTGIREATILGQGIGASMRGLRPVVDIQYLDYLLYAIQTMSDDLATLRYRTKGGQSAPVIVRTKGHRLEGIWHTGSPLGMIISALKGIHVCVPRNMVQAVGLYNTLFEALEPALVIEVLNGYRLKEKVPDNLESFKIALGEVEILKSGLDLTVVTYGACCKVAEDASLELKKLGIDLEIIDVQTLMPFDTSEKIVESIKKTGSVIFFDEDVPGGATSYMMQKVLESQGAYDYLDSKPRTLTASENRAAFGSDGDYFCKPNMDDLIELVYSILREKRPNKLPESIY